MPTRGEGRRFNVGDAVMARWPRSSLYFAGTVQDFNDIEYLVRFDDEDQSELAIKFKDVEAPFSRSGRSSSRGRASPSRKSPGRKSPGRKSPGRKSPGRKSPGRRSPSRKSPTKRSPARKKEATPPAPEPIVTSRSALRPADEATTAPPTEGVVVPNKESSPALRNRSSQVTVLSAASSSSSTQTTTVTSNRHSARLAAAVDQKKLAVADGANSNSIKVDASKVVKAIEERNRVLEFLKRLLLCFWETFKALPLAALIFLLPFVLGLLCTAKKCDITWPTLPQKMPSIVEKKPLAMVGGYLLSLLVLALIPLGKVVHTDNGSKIRCNAYLSLVTVAVAVGVLLKTDFNLSSVYLYYRHFLLLFTSLAVVLSVFLYVKSFWAKKTQLNPHGTTGYYVVDFIRGRELNPRIGSFDLKFFLFRIGIVSIIFLNLLIVAKNLQGKPGDYSPTLLVATGMQIFYCLDFLLFEDSFLTTYEYTSQGLGFMSCIIYLTMAFVTTTTTKFVLNHGVDLIWYCLVGIVGLNLAGYTILRGANSQKHAFRINPADPALVHLESLPTSTRKRLIVSGWWGLVRHPNYLGEIIVQLSWALTCGFSHSIPWIVLGVNVIYLIGRIFSVERACRDKYGLAWSSYTARVPCRLIPKVF